MSALEPQDQQWRALASPGRTYRFCDNAQFDVCNWLVADDWDERLCVACRHNRTIPDHTQPETLILWRKLEVAKHRLFYTLLRLRLPLANRDDEPADGLAFDFIADKGTRGDKVMTGHDNGIITIALREADDVEREQRRHDMREAYRTTLGHFRHEIGHYYWDRLVKNDASIDRFRELFGDEREDYAAALERHYGQGSKTERQEHFVSAYASAHPWEDFAETWAHYLHIIDSLEAAGSFGLQIHPKIDSDLHTNVNFDPHHAQSIDQLIEAWLPVTFAANSLARSMGQPDLYPFILSPTVIVKLGMVHDLIHQRVGRTVALSTRSGT